VKAPLPWRIARTVLWLAIVGILGAVAVRDPAVGLGGVLILVAGFFPFIPSLGAR